MSVDLSNQSLCQRLLLAGSPRDSWNWDDPKQGIDYVQVCHLTREDIPELTELAKKWADLEWIEFLERSQNDPNHDAKQLLPVTAWRGLACLNASEVAAELLELLNFLAAEDDDWSLEDYPRIFAMFGPETLERLMQFACDRNNHPWATITAIDSIAEIGKRHEASSATVTEWLTGQMRNAENNTVEVNSTLLVALLDLQAVSAAEAIERAFAADRIDAGMTGDWETVRNELGVPGLGLAMPKHPANSLRPFPGESEGEVFSDVPLFDAGEVDDGAVGDYCEQAMETFSVSPEGREVIARNGETRWVYTFLELGAQYLGVSVNTMTVRDASEIVFELIPRKVLVDADAAGPIVFEMRKFWQFIAREFRLPNALEIAGLFDEEALDELYNELSDSSSFGMAKSLFALGNQAGFDMTSQDGLDDFMLAYNSSLPARPDLDDARPSPPTMSADEKRAFNKQRQKKLKSKLKK